MKKLAALLIAAFFGLSAALPVTAVAAAEDMAIVPATKPVKVAKAKKIKKVKKANIAKKAKKKPVRANRRVHRR